MNEHHLQTKTKYLQSEKLLIFESPNPKTKKPGLDGSAY